MISVILPHGDSVVLPLIDVLPMAVRHDESVSIVAVITVSVAISLIITEGAALRVVDLMLFVNHGRVMVYGVGVAVGGHPT